MPQHKLDDKLEKELDSKLNGYSLEALGWIRCHAGAEQKAEILDWILDAMRVEPEFFWDFVIEAVEIQKVKKEHREKK